MTDKIGIMDGAYFVGRKELLSWLNTLLEINYKKVEQISNGAAMCQVMDTMYPNKNALSKVNFNATMDFEVLNNFKILQSEFKRVGIEKVVDIERLKQGRFQDNLEFFQWMKRYYDINPHSDASTYRARERRMEAGCPEPKEVHGGLPTRSRSHSSSAITSSASKRQKYTPNVPISSSQSVRTTVSTRNPPMSSSFSSSSSSSSSSSTSQSTQFLSRSQSTQQQQQSLPYSVSTRTAKPSGRPSQAYSSVISSSASMAHTQQQQQQQKMYTQTASMPPSASTRTRSGSTGLKAKHASNDPGDIKAVVSVRELTSLQETISSLEKERDFYYERLVRVETLCKSVKEGEMQQKYPGANKKLVSAILRILYDDGTGPTIEVDDDDDDDENIEDNAVVVETTPSANVVPQAQPALVVSPVTPQQQTGGNALFSTPAVFSPPAASPISSVPPATAGPATSSTSLGFDMKSNCAMGTIGDVNISTIGVESSVDNDNDINMN